MAARIGFLGGTLDPPHRGHVQLARVARDRLQLERVLLAPAAVQPLKHSPAVAATWKQRLVMVQLAIAGEPKLEASELDGPRRDGQPNYSVETIAMLRDLYPENDIFFLLGADAFAGLRRWRQPERLLALCDLVVASRPGYPLPADGNDLLEWMPAQSRFLGTEEIRGTDALVYLCGNAMVRVCLLPELAEDISATELREELARGEGLQHLPGGARGAVANYIREQKLYGV